jgi:4-amino-4-deoxy-L-arabinose transferase-like glycosyltransferase
MHVHGASLLPGAMDLDVSRGHPLLFPALFSLWVSLFGKGHVAMHSGAMVISCLLLITVYEVAVRLFNRRVAMISLLLVCVHILFFIDSSFVLPDMLIALLTLLSLYFYAKEKYIAAAIALTLLFYTKESTLILGIVIGIDAFLALFNSKIPKKVALYKCITIAVPFLLTAVFYVLQKATYGWYLNPGHIGLIDIIPGHTFLVLRVALDILFRQNSEYSFFLLLLLLSIAAAIRSRNPRYLSLFLPAIALFFLKRGADLSEIMSLLLFLLLFGGAFLLFSPPIQMKHLQQTAQKKFIYLGLFFFITYLYFSCINFFEGRYLMPAMIISMIFIAVLFEFFISRTDSRLFYPVLCTLAGLGIYIIAADNQKMTSTPFTRMYLQQAIVDYFEKNNLYNSTITTGAYLDYAHLKDPNTGYLRSSRSFTNVFCEDFQRRSEYVEFNTAEIYNWQPYVQVTKDTAYILAYRVEKDGQWAEIYRRRH